MSETKKPYVILDSETLEGMQNAVRALLLEGYVVLGGCQVVSHRPDGLLTESGLRFFQTMVFNEV